MTRPEDKCGFCESPAITELDGDNLCQRHANEWLRAEEEAQREAETRPDGRVFHCAAALNVLAGVYLDATGHAHPITNWFDADGDECPREDAVTCVAGSDAQWFALSIADFSETGARA